jgi:hypothetical protein
MGGATAVCSILRTVILRPFSQSDGGRAMMIAEPLNRYVLDIEFTRW